MKLLTSPTSPFARKAQIVARELGLAVEDETVGPLPTKIDPRVSAANPLGKIPALILDSGEALYDSRVIVEYMCSLSASQTLLPIGEKRFDVLRRQALADGITDAAVLIRYETFLRPKECVWSDWIAAQEGKIAAGLNVLEMATATSQAVDVGSIATVCALDYLVFRAIGADPLAGRPALTALREVLSQRPAFRETQPRA